MLLFDKGAVVAAVVVTFGAIMLDRLGGKMSEVRFTAVIGIDDDDAAAAPPTVAVVAP
jgi:hypothetical protein